MKPLGPLALASALMLTSCANFRDLGKDLKLIDDNYRVPGIIENAHSRNAPVRAVIAEWDRTSDQVFSGDLVDISTGGAFVFLVKSPLNQFVAAYLMPAGIGDASLAGLPPAAGLYACLFSGLVFWLFTSSQQTSVTVISAISLLVGASLGTLSNGDPARHATLAATTAVLVAALAMVALLFRAGVIVNFISESVMIGFKCGVGMHLAASQLPKLCGFHGSHGDFWERAGHFIRHAGETNAASLALGGCALAVLLLAKRLLPRKLVALIVVLAPFVLGAYTALEVRGGKMLGEVPQGLPVLGLHSFQWSDVNLLLPLAMTCFMLDAVETAAIGRMFARKHGLRLDSDQEFLALAGANLASGLGKGFPTSGGMSQSLVNESSGAKTPHPDSSHRC